MSPSGQKGRGTEKRGVRKITKKTETVQYVLLASKRFFFLSLPHKALFLSLPFRYLHITCETEGEFFLLLLLLLLASKEATRPQEHVSSFQNALGFPYPVCVSCNTHPVHVFDEQDQGKINPPPTAARIMHACEPPPPPHSQIGTCYYWRMEEAKRICTCHVRYNMYRTYCGKKQASPTHTHRCG